MNSARRTPLNRRLPQDVPPVHSSSSRRIAAVAPPGWASATASRLKANGAPTNNLVITTLMAKFYPAGMLGVGLTGLVASFMSGMAGNVTAFNRSGLTTFTRPISGGTRRPALSQRRTGHHYCRRAALHRRRLRGHALRQHHGPAAVGLRICQRAALFATLPSGPCSGSAAPATAAFSGLRHRTVACFGLTWCLTGPRAGRHSGHRLHLPLRHGPKFLDRPDGFTSCLLVTLVVSLATKPRPEKELRGWFMAFPSPEDRGQLVSAARSPGREGYRDPVDIEFLFA